MFVDDGRGWGRPGEPIRKAALSVRQERIVLHAILIMALLTLIAPIGGGTIIQAIAALVENLR